MKKNKLHTFIIQLCNHCDSRDNENITVKAYTIDEAIEKSKYLYDSNRFSIGHISERPINGKRKRARK